jgi:hypothetical protein
VEEVEAELLEPGARKPLKPDVAQAATITPQSRSCDDSYLTHESKLCHDPRFFFAANECSRRPSVHRLAHAGGRAGSSERIGPFLDNYAVAEYPDADMDEILIQLLLGLVELFFEVFLELASEAVLDLLARAASDVFKSAEPRPPVATIFYGAGRR